MWILRYVDGVVEEPDAEPPFKRCPKCGSDECVGDFTTAFDFGSQVSCYKCGYFELRDPVTEEARVREEKRRAEWKPPQASRPTTEEVVDLLDFARRCQMRNDPDRACMAEAIRRVRAHAKARDYLCDMQGTCSKPVVVEVRALLALLDGDGT